MHLIVNPASRFVRKTDGHNSDPFRCESYLGGLGRKNEGQEIYLNSRVQQTATQVCFTHWIAPNVMLDVPGHVPVYCTGELTATRSPPPLAKEHNQSSCINAS